MTAEQAGKGRSRAHAFVDYHVVEDADDGAPVAVVVGNGQRCHACGRTAGRRSGVGPDAVDKCPYPGEVGGHAVPRRASAVAVERPVAVGRQDPAVPADLAERHPQRVAAAARLSVPAPAVGVPLSVAG